MALLKFKHGLQENLNLTKVPYVEGTIYIATDTNRMYVDMNEQRHLIGTNVISYANGLEHIPTEYAQQTGLFYFNSESVPNNEGGSLCYWDSLNSKYRTIITDDVFYSLVEMVDTSITAINGQIQALTDNVTNLETAVASINASTVETTTSFKVTTAVGNYKIGDTVPKDDIQKIIMDMLSKDVYPTRTEDASASISLTGAGAKEVGTEFTPKFSFSTKGGKYNANGVEQAANVTYNTFSVTESGRPDGAAAGTSTSSSGSFTKFTVTDNTNYKLTGSCKSTQGDIPKTYLGSDYDVDDNTIDVRINAKDWNNLSSSAVTGYRGCFYGYYSEKKLTPTALTSAQVRGLCPSAKSALTGFLTYDNTNKYYHTTTNKMQQMFFAAPKGKYSTVEVANSTNGAPQTVTKITDVMVEGLNGYTTAAYDVWYVDNAAAESGETKFKVTIS